MTAIGFILFSISYTVDVRGGTYPPYAANSFALLPASAFLILFDIYASALSLSQDVTLRKCVKSLARNERNLLSSIGTAQMENEITRAGDSMKAAVDEEEARMKEKSGLDTPMEKDEIENYLQQAMAEVKKSRNTPDT